MTVVELANLLNATVQEIFEHYKKIFVAIPQDEHYILTLEQIRKAIPNNKLKEKSNDDENKIVIKNLFSKKEEIKTNNQEYRAKRVEILDKLAPYFNIQEAELLLEIKNYNTIPDFIFEGEYKKIDENNFVFFYNIIHQNGNNWKWGFVDKDGRVVIPFIYDNGWNFTKGIVAVKKNGKSFYISTKGECVKD